MSARSDRSSVQPASRERCRNPGRRPAARDRDIAAAPRAHISGLRRRTRAMVRSSRKASSSPFRQHQPLQREQAVRATRASKPEGSGRSGEANRSQCFAVRNSRNASIRCSRSRRTRSGGIGANPLSLRGTITGRLSSSMTRCFRGMPKHNGSVLDGPASACQAEGTLGKHPADQHDDVVPGRFARLLNGLRSDPGRSQLVTDSLRSYGPRPARPFARGPIPAKRPHCFGRNTGMRQSCPSGRSSQTSGP